MHKFIAIASLLTAVFLALFLIKFDSQEGRLIFSGEGFNSVDTKVGIVEHGIENSLFLVNIRLVYDSSELCFKEEKCGSNLIENKRYTVQTSVGNVSFGLYSNCTGEPSSNCVKVGSSDKIYNYDRIFVGNLNIPRSLEEVEIKFPIFNDCGCENFYNDFAEATLEIRQMKRPLYKYFLDALLSV